MILSINQPAYLPWLGYFERIARSDLHIVLDDVKIERNTKTSFTNRNKIRTTQDWSWLTVPVSRGETLEDEIIKNVKTDNIHWKKKHLRSLNQSYTRTPFYQEHQPWFEEFYAQQWTYLAPMLKASTENLLDTLGIKTPLLYSSEMNVGGHKSELVLNFCKEVGADTYVSGPFGRDYLDLESFSEENIDVEFSEYIHPEYKQYHGEFIPYMSIVDLIFNHGSESLNILMSD